MVCGIECGNHKVSYGVLSCRTIYSVNQSCIYLWGVKSEFINITQGVAQGCTLSPTLFLIFVDFNEGD